MRRGLGPDGVVGQPVRGSGSGGDGHGVAPTRRAVRTSSSSASSGAVAIDQAIFRGAGTAPGPSAVARSGL